MALAAGTHALWNGSLVLADVTYIRRRLPRARRRDFDRVHAALARLSLRQEPGVDPGREPVLADQLGDALTRYRG